MTFIIHLSHDWFHKIVLAGESGKLYFEVNVTTICSQTIHVYNGSWAKVIATDNSFWHLLLVLIKSS